MKLYHFIWTLYHSALKRWHRREGYYQTAKFEHHHNRIKHHKGG